MEKFHKDDYRFILNQVFQKRRAKNSQYSMRSFARDLKIGVTSLHGVMTSNRHLSRANLEKIAKYLRWDDCFYAKAKLQVRYGKVRMPASNFDKNSFQEIYPWYFFAVLALCKACSRTTDPQWFADRLNIPLSNVKKALKLLQQHGLIEKTKDSFKQTASSIYFENDNSKSIRRHHLEFMSKAKKATEDHWEDTGNFVQTLSIDPEILPKVLELSNSFLIKLQRLAQASEPRDVYSMVMTFFPLTKRPVKD